MKKIIWLILGILLISISLFALKSGTVSYLELTSDSSDSGGLYTWTDVSSGYELKDGYYAAKFTYDLSNQVIYNTSAITQNIKTATYDIWVSSTQGTDDWRYLATNGPNQGSLQYYQNTLYFYDTDGGGAVTAPDTTIPRDQWVNIAVVYDDVTGDSYLYVNGVNVLTQSTCTHGMASFVWAIGNNGWSWNQSFNCWIRNFRLMTTIETDFPIIDPVESPTDSPTETPVVSPTNSPTPSPTSTIDCYGWGDKVAAVWELDNDKIDSIAGYVLTPVNSGGDFDNVNTPPFGTYYYYTYYSNNYDKFPAGPQTALSGLTEWTIEARMWFPTKTAGVHALYMMSRGTSSSAVGSLGVRIIDSTNWPNNNTIGVLFYNGSEYQIAGDMVNYPAGGIANSWNRVTLCYNASGVKLYLNGTEAKVVAGSFANVFDTTALNDYFYTSSEFSNDWDSYRTDGTQRFIFYTDDTQGEEIVKIDLCSSPTDSPTVSPTISPTASATATRTPVIEQWIQLTEHAAWPVRGFASSAIFQGRMWILGGTTRDGGTMTQYNDVWWTLDGVNWYAATTTAPWVARRRPYVWVYDDKIWIGAGINSGGTYLKDVWYSSDGVDWILATGNAAFGDANIVGGLPFGGGRIAVSQRGIVYDNKMWVISGQILDIGPVNDAWYSTNGADWYASTRNAEFKARSGGSLAVHDNKIFISGGAWDGDTNDVWWTSDGVFWTLVGDLDQGHLQHHTMESFLDFLWIFGGSTANPGPDQQYAMFLEDEVLPWHYDTEGYGIRGAHCSEIYNGNIYIFGGFNNEDTEPTPLNDVWVSKLTNPLDTPTPTITQTDTVTFTITPTFTLTITNTITPTLTATPIILPTVINTPTKLDFWASKWSAEAWEVLGNTTLAMDYYYKATTIAARYNMVDDEMGVLYQAGLMLTKKFKSLTSYSANVKAVALATTVAQKATAKADFIATMTPVYSLLPDADIHLSRAQSITTAVKYSTPVQFQRDFIKYVSTYVANP